MLLLDKYFRGKKENLGCPPDNQTCKSGCPPDNQTCKSGCPVPILVVPGVRTNDLSSLAVILEAGKPQLS